jgi:hypothetical protein
MSPALPGKESRWFQRGPAAPAGNARCGWTRASVVWYTTSIRLRNEDSDAVLAPAIVRVGFQPEFGASTRLVLHFGSSLSRKAEQGRENEIPLLLWALPVSGKTAGSEAGSHAPRQVPLFRSPINGANRTRFLVCGLLSTCPRGHHRLDLLCHLLR